MYIVCLLLKDIHSNSFRQPAKKDDGCFFDGCLLSLSLAKERLAADQSAVALAKADSSDFEKAKSKLRRIAMNMQRRVLTIGG